MKLFLLVLLLCTQQAKAQLDKIIPIKLSMSNAYLIRGEKFVLIDCGGVNDWELLNEQLSHYGLKPEDISTLILTHAHADHAGLAARFAANGHTRIIAGKGDLSMMGEGRNDFLKPTNYMAMLLKLFINQNYPSFIPSILLDGTTDLEAYGSIGRVIPMPGHTPGSLIVVLPDGTAFVGDMILGGFFGGALFPSYPQEHYFHEDRERNNSNIGKVLLMGVQTFYLGHGGPVSRSNVIQAFNIVL